MGRAREKRPHSVDVVPLPFSETDVFLAPSCPLHLSPFLFCLPSETALPPRPPTHFSAMTGSCRVDVTDGTVDKFDDLPHSIPVGPPAFIPRVGACDADEDDGVVLLDYLGADGNALIIVLDGRTFSEVARVTLPYRHCYSNCFTWVGSATQKCE